MKKQLFMGGLVIGSLLALAPDVHGFTKITIDDFTLVPDKNPLDITGGRDIGNGVDPVSPKSNTTIGPETSIIGGERELTFERLFSRRETSIGTVTIDNSELVIDNPSNYNSRTTILWNGTDANPLNADLSEQDFFTIQVPQTDEVPFNLSLTVVDNENNTSTVTRPGRDIEGNVNIFFEEFDLVNFKTGTIQSIALIIEGENNDGFDATITFVSSEPIPESSALLGLCAFAGLGILSKKVMPK